mgnify:CR=1 FL=1
MTIRRNADDPFALRSEPQAYHWHAGPDASGSGTRAPTSDSRGLSRRIALFRDRCHGMSGIHRRS